MTEPTLAVVVPAHQAEDDLPKCLDALFAAGFEPGEILVVDDGSRDGTGDVARKANVRVVRNDRPAEPAEARNRGAREVEAEILVFVDADVVIHKGARRRILEHFKEPDIVAVFGSYDDAPPAPTVVSRYRNLLHHFVHQQSRAEAATFWTGFGAVRREAFLALGGFDRDWQNIEDVEFGVRLKRTGARIRLDRELLCTHLKAWSLRSMLKTDLWGRAVPWSRLLLFEGWSGDDLNATAPHRWSAAAVVAGAAGLIAAPFFPLALIVTAAALAVFVAANAPFLRFLSGRKGLGFAAAALPYHILHYGAATLGLGYAVATRLTQR